jgi:hypothetical protein
LGGGPVNVWAIIDLNPEHTLPVGFGSYDLDGPARTEVAEIIAALALVSTMEELNRAAIVGEIFAGVCQHLQHSGKPETMLFERFVKRAVRIYELVVARAREGSELQALS